MPSGVYKRKPLADRFWAKVDKRAVDKCWTWTGAKDLVGYGRLSICRRSIKAHVVSWELHNGVILDGMSVIHTCGVRACVKPSHLQLEKRKSLESRFWNRVDKQNTNDCWLWTASTGTTGYGRINDGKGQMVGAHRLSWEIYHEKKIPKGMCVLHACDVRACVNPAHLWIGTKGDNNLDSRQKGRHQHGENHAQAKLVNEDVINIREMYESGIATQQSIGILFGVSQRTIGLIVKRKSWTHI